MSSTSMSMSSKRFSGATSLLSDPRSPKCSQASSSSAAVLPSSLPLRTNRMGFATIFPGVAATWEQFATGARVPEKKELIADIQSGNYTLWLEHNTRQWCKCRARECLVAAQPNLARYEDRIQGPYRCDLAALKPSAAHWSQFTKPDRRYFHLTCIESIMGSDLPGYLKLPATVIFRPPTPAGAGILSHQDITFEPIVRDWIRNAGRTFWAEAYNNAEYQEVRQQYCEGLVAWAMSHRQNCKAGVCDCKASEPVQPKLEDFVTGDPWERSLCDVALDTIGAGHLIQVAKYPKLESSMKAKLVHILEDLGTVPPALSEDIIMRILNRLKKNKQERRARERESSQAQKSVDKRFVSVEPAEQTNAGGEAESG